MELSSQNDVMQFHQMLNAKENKKKICMLSQASRFGS
jgi:hypothetical protein